MRVSCFLLFVALIVCSSAGAGQPGIHEMPGLQSTEEFDRAAFNAEQNRLHTWLVSEQIESGLVSPVSIRLTAREIHDIERGSCEGCLPATEALLAGMIKPVEMSFDLRRPSHGAIELRADGGLVWSAAIASNDAAGLRVHFTDFSLPAGFELWLYSMAGDVRGPYRGQGPTGSGGFWSHTISGPTAMLQLRSSGLSARASTASFAISDLGHVGRAATLKTFCSFNADCIENGECDGTDPAVSVAKNAIAHMQYVKRPYIYFCSGGLLNSSINPGTPYFLTANHCVSRDREAGTLEAFFQFTIPCGSTACPDYNQITAPSTLGSTVLATNSTSDFTLLELSQQPHSSCAFMGWTNSPVVGTGDTIYRISHPGGAPQAYSEHLEWNPNDVSTVLECSGWPRGQWIYSQDQFGATEGGSSGSPVVNALGQVVGQLSGACGYELDDNCDNINNSTVDGAFAAYYDQVAPWLGTGVACTDNDEDGSCADTDCDDNDPLNFPNNTEDCNDGQDNNCNDLVDDDDPFCISCTDNDEDGSCADVDCDDNDPLNFPGNTEDCSDGQDNNCDGLADAFDPTCATCGLVGDPCNTGADCCSLRCHPRRNTCK